MPYKTALAYFIFISLLVIVGIQAFFLSLPMIVESQIKSRLPLLSPAFKPDFSIEAMGITRTIFRDLRFGEDLTIDLAELRYQWMGGRAFKVKQLRISGLSLCLGIDESNQIRFNDRLFPGQDMAGASGTKTKAFSWQDLAGIFPLIPEQIRVENSQVTLRGKQGDIRMPLDIFIGMDAKQGRGDVRLGTRLLGQSFDLRAALDLKAALDQGPEKALSSLEAAAPGFDPGCMALLFPDVFRDFALTGPVDVRVKGQGQGPWQFLIRGGIVRGETLPQIRLVQFRGRVEGGHLTGTGEARIQGGGLSDLGLDLTVSAGFEPGREPKVNLSVKTQEMDVLSLDLTRAGWIKKGLPGKIIVSRPGFSLEAEGTRSRQECRLRFTGQSLGAGFADGNLRVNQFFLAAGLKRVDNGLFPIESGEFEFQAKALASQSKGAGLTSPLVTLTAGIKPDHKNKKLSINFDTALAGARAVSRSSTLYMDKAGGSGTIFLDQDYLPSGRVVAGIKNASLDLRDKDVSVTGMDIHLPLTYPFNPKTRSGSILVKALTYDKRFTARLSGDVTQTRDMGLALKGEIVSRDIADLVLDLGVDAGLDPTSLAPWGEITLASEKFALTRDDLIRLLPGAQIPGGFNMDLSTNAGISLKNNNLDTRGSIQIHDGSLDFPDLDLKVQGISGQVDFNDLILPESLPGQAIFVESLTAGQFRFDDGAFRFSVEDGRSLNLENMRFKWCNGLVSTESLRLPPADDKISLTLYCDRLEMDSLLRQIGAFDAQGGGTLSGRIPVVYDKAEISFDNGFLFSTPGQGGRVFVKDLDRMLEGFPKNTPEFSQLDLAGEALKDFQYDWAKLTLNTRGDTLDVKMELDGKPAGILPFEYSKDMNSFMRVDASSPGSRFQGVKLDVNLKLPFNRVMKFGNKLRNILE